VAAFREMSQMRSGSSNPPVAPRHTATQRRLLTAFAGVGVVALTGVAFALSYDDLRALALAGRAATRYAPAYPIMYDALIVITILSLLVARNARWWSRWARWVLLLVLLIGAAAASIQRAVQGYESLPDQVLVAGVAAAPHVMLVIAVWLWLAMFRHARSALARRAAQPRLGPVAQVAEEIPAAQGGYSAAYQGDYRDGDLVPGLRAAEASPEYAEPATAEIADFTEFDDAEPSVRVLRDADGLTPYPEYPEPRYGQPEYPRPHAPEDERKPSGLSNEPPESDDTSPFEPQPEPEPEPEPNGGTPRPAALPPESPSSPSSSGVRLVDRVSIIGTATTRPDIVVPDTLDSAEDDVDAPSVERAEDPDAGDGEPVGGLRLQPAPRTTDGLNGSGRDNGQAEGDIDDAAGDGDSSDDDDDDVDFDIERWSVTAAEDAERWADDATDRLSDDGPDHTDHTTEDRTDLEWPPSSTFRSSPTPPTG
jgi:uncharacterized protein DUF2637